MEYWWKVKFIKAEARLEKNSQPTHIHGPKLFEDRTNANFLLDMEKEIKTFELHTSCDLYLDGRSATLRETETGMDLFLPGKKDTWA